MSDEELEAAQGSPEEAGQVEAPVETPVEATEAPAEATPAPSPEAE